VIGRIFAGYLSGKGVKAIAEALTADGIRSPSAYDPARNPHRCGIAWLLTGNRHRMEGSCQPPRAV